MKKLILITIFLMLLGAGCSSEENYNNRAMTACIDKGGIPFLENTNGYMEDCDFPPVPTSASLKEEVRVLTTRVDDLEGEQEKISSSTKALSEEVFDD